MSETTSDCIAQLDLEIEVMAQVLVSLGAEREALFARDAEALENALTEKNAWLGRVAELEQQRRPVADIDAGNAVTSRWHKLMDLAQQCRASNLHNGALIRGQRRRVEDTLHWLRGDSDATRVYGPDGERHGGAKTRATLASA